MMTGSCDAQAGPHPAAPADTQNAELPGRCAARSDEAGNGPRADSAIGVRAQAMDIDSECSFPRATGYAGRCI